VAPILIHARALRRLPVLLVAVAIGAASLVAIGDLEHGSARAAIRDDVRIAVGEPTTYDPAAAGDSGSSAVIAQLFETLTTFDPGLVLRPALAGSWSAEDGGRRMVFTLRPGLTFSDGAPLAAADVVRSWLRVIDPVSPSPLASLLDQVEGAVAYRQGAGTADSVGIVATDERTVEVRLVRPVGDFPAIVASPTFGIVPSGMSATADPTGLAVSGGYRVASITSSEIKLEANDRYWAGRPAIGIIHLVTDLGGQSPVEVFAAGDIDYTPISPYDASWLAYDKTLGAALREVPSLGVTYYGFDTTRPPFDDVRVRQAFAAAVDWRRIAELGAVGGSEPATSMVPTGIPGRSESDFLPAHDIAKAQELLAAAGYPGGAGFPPVTLVSPGTGHDEAIIRELHDALGVDIAFETMAFDEYFDRLETEPPAIWALSWIADYPGPNDFLGLLLGSGGTNNYGHWSSADFDAAITDALEAPDAAATRAAFDRAESIVRDDAPVVPIEYGTSWALSAKGLLGAGQNGLSIMRMAGLAWSD
jgi:ABC-type oligopeptide transport system substrate-binding subunit